MNKKEIRRRLRRSGICKLAALAAAAVLTFTCLIGVTRAETADMRPAIHAGDVLVYLRPGRPVGTDVFLYRAGETGSGGPQQAAAQPEGEGPGQRAQGKLAEGKAEAALSEGGLQLARLQTTEGLPEEMADDGIPVLRRLPPKDQLQGRLLLIIRRRPI